MITMRFQGKITLIAGVSKGLGYALAYMLSKEGGSVILVSRDEERLKQICAKVSGCSYVIADLGEEEGTRRVERAVEKLDHLVISVGGYEEDTVETLSALEAMIESHVRIPLRLIRSLLPKMNRGGSIVLFSSVVSVWRAQPNQLSYAVAKAATAKAVEVLASELIDYEIRVNGVAPSYILGDFEPGRDYKTMRKLGQRGAPPEDFANVALWLLSDESSWVDGVVVPVDGGWRLRG
jgi:3-oxoacyl-[acyl-carrier protein] reductase